MPKQSVLQYPIPSYIHAPFTIRWLNQACLPKLVLSNVEWKTLHELAFRLDASQLNVSFFFNIFFHFMFTSFLDCRCYAPCILWAPGPLPFIMRMRPWRQPINKFLVHLFLSKGLLSCFTVACVSVVFLAGCRPGCTSFFGACTLWSISGNMDSLPSSSPTHPNNGA